jgi:hypothetical protein
MSNKVVRWCPKQRGGDENAESELKEDPASWSIADTVAISEAANIATLTHVSFQLSTNHRSARRSNVRPPFQGGERSNRTLRFVRLVSWM